MRAASRGEHLLGLAGARPARGLRLFGLGLRRGGAGPDRPLRRRLLFCLRLGGASGSPRRSRRLGRLLRRGGSAGGGSDGGRRSEVEALEETRLAAGGGVGVDDALLGGV